MKSRYLSLAFASSVTLSLAFACSSKSEDCTVLRTCAGDSGSGGGSGSAGKGGTAGKGGAGGGTSGNGGDASGGEGAMGMAGTASGGEAGAGGGCDTTASPSEEGCLVTDEHAVFVAPDGDDDGAGTMAEPLATLTAAVAAAGEKIVIVCDGSYDEFVVIETGAVVYGGFDCESWQPTEGAPLFQPSAAGPALKIDGVEEAVSIEGVDFAVGDAVGDGASAVTAIVNESAAVTLTRVILTAGAGEDGAAGGLTDFEYPADASLDGNDEGPVTLGGGAKTCNCQTGLSSTGGIGGAAVPSGQDGSDGLPGHGLGLGGDSAAGDCGAGSTGGKGADAPDRPAAEGAMALGLATAAGWEPGKGGDGEIGSPGQGGGGGASLNDLGHGGGGACGGCGGNGGKGGQGGGGSIGLLVRDSSVVLESAIIQTGDAGSGGAGAAGQTGQQDVGTGGNAIDGSNSCDGGVGGKGGDGGAGGGGAGGISAGIVWTGETAPTVSDDTMITPGNAGAPGEGGAGTNDGIAGVQQEVLPLD